MEIIYHTEPWDIPIFRGKIRSFQQRECEGMAKKVREGQALSTLAFILLHFLHAEITVYVPCCFPGWTRAMPEDLSSVASVWGQMKNDGG